MSKTQPHQMKARFENLFAFLGHIAAGAAARQPITEASARPLE